MHLFYRTFIPVFLFFFLFSPDLNAQLSGVITDESGQPLPFANVFIKGTTTGTTSNPEGNYRLELDPGSYTLVFEFLGYRSIEKKVSITASPLTMDVQLFPEAYKLQEVKVEANAEDPAYRVIRKAIEKRKYYKELVASYRCDAYVKGMQKIFDAPEKILGQEVGDMGGMLDSTRQGIVYLSESESTIFYQAPNEKKEVMISSRVSGDDNGFSFNRASLMDFSFYENSLDLIRRLVSPIGNSAMAYYEYQLAGTFVDNDGRLINRIKVIPKRKEDPVFAGYIQIVEDLWLIHSVELFITGKNIQQPILDTLFFRQSYVPVEAPDKWMIFSQTLDFDLAIFGFKIGGYFTGVFSNYDLKPEIPANFFKGEIFRIRDSANLKPQEYWEENRPIPLTVDEDQDYIRKDSLQAIWNSRVYMDSTDRVENKFDISNIFFGYSYRNSYKNFSIDVQSPATTIQFNAVQGWLADLSVNIRKARDEDKTRWFSINPFLSYGFSDEQFRGGLKYTHQFNAFQYPRLSLEAGKKAAQFNEAEPISPMLNLFYSLYLKENYMRLYDKYFASLQYGQEVVNGLRLDAQIAYEDRLPLVNTTNYSFRKKDTPYFVNDPRLMQREEPDIFIGFPQHQALFLDVQLRLRIKQRYSTYPHRRLYHGSDWPEFKLNYRKGIKVLDSDVNYDRLSLSVEDSYSIGLGGQGELFMEGGAFLGDPELFFMDFFHFEGNQTAVGNPENYNQSFFLLPYYEFSTEDKYLQIHGQHRFKGFLLDKVPLVRKLGWQTCLTGKLLHQGEESGYYEMGVGLENIGFGIFRMFRLDYVWSFYDGKKRDEGIIVGIRL
jgi:hypothetical protein